MEASVAAGGEAAQVEGGEAAQAPAGPDLGPLLEQNQAILSRLESYEPLLQQLAPQEEEQEGEEFDLSALYGGEEQEPSADAQAIAQLFQQMQATVQQQGQASQQETAQLRAMVSDMLVDRTAETLTQQFPKLADPQVAEATVSHARQVAQSIGLDPAVLQSPQGQAFLTLVIRAQEAEQHAAGELPVDGIRQHSLEAGAGAAPGAQGGGPTIAEQILSAGKAKNSFWGV
jgi:hypothetical protein